MKIGFLGGGKMAEGILSALISCKKAKAADILVAEKVPARAQFLADAYGVKTTPDLAAVVKTCKVVFLAVRPQDVDAVAAGIKPLLRTAGVTLVSIVAGKTLAVLKKAFGNKVAIVRVMPNLALRVGEGMCAVCGKGKEDVAALLDVAGKTVILPEKAFDAVTALSGSGPAYFAYMLKAMAEAGVKLGLKPADARCLAEQTMLGTAKYLRATEADLDAFIAGVCTPGGTTAAGMAELSRDGLFAQLVARTLAAAAQRARELK